MEKVSTILSQVEVDENDEAFRNPTKPIGRFLTKEEAERKRKQKESAAWKMPEEGTVLW